MRLAFVQDRLRMGGTERQTVTLANAFAKAGHDVLLVTFRPGGPLAQEVSDQVLRIALQKHDLGLDWYSPGLVRVLRGFAPEVVQLMGRMANCQGWRISTALPRVRCVATFRTGKTIPAPYRWTLRRAHAIVANSAEAQQRLAAVAGIPVERVRLIRNAVTEPATAPDGSRAEVRAEFATPAETLVFLCVAMMRPGKGHRRLIETAGRLRLSRPWELWLAGDGSRFPECLALVQASPARANLRLLGMRSDVNRLYRAADVAVLASGVESLPNFLVEAQWNGLPVVAADVAGVAETFAPNESGLLVPLHDGEALREALERVAREDAWRQQAARAAREFARREFAPEVQHRRYLELYAELIGP